MEIQYLSVLPECITVEQCEFSLAPVKRFFLLPVLALQGVYAVLSFPAGLVILVGMIIQDPVIRNFSYKRVSNYLLKIF